MVGSFKDLILNILWEKKDLVELNVWKVKEEFNRIRFEV